MVKMGKGNYGYFGADGSLIPFSSGVNEIAFGWNGSNFGGGIIKKMELH